MLNFKHSDWLKNSNSQSEYSKVYFRQKILYRIGPYVRYNQVDKWDIKRSKNDPKT